MTKQQATRNAKALAKRCGKQWKIEVWENLGWHFHVLSPDGRVSVHECQYMGKNKKKYYCMFTRQTDYPAVGDPNWYSNKYFADPKDAVLESLKVAVKELKRCEEAVNMFKDLYFKSF